MSTAFTYSALSGRDSARVVAHLRTSFFADEPLNRAVGLCVRGAPHAGLERLCAATLQDGVSVGVLQGDKIVGVALNGIIWPGDLEASLDKIKVSDDEKFNKIFRFLYSQGKDLDLFKRYNVDKIMECRIISVSEDCRGHGLAKALMQRSIRLAKENNFRIFKVDATGVYSQRICQSLGLETIKQVRYDEHLDEDGQVIFNVEPPHESLCIMIMDTSNS